MNDIHHIHALIYAPPHVPQIISANNIITKHNLHFTTDDILKAFNSMRDSGYHLPVSMMNFALSKNLRMFIAIVCALIDDKMPKLWQNWVYDRNNHNGDPINSIRVHHENIKYVSKIWCDLYDYYEFDISELELPDILRESIQQHIDSKQPYTKRAIK